MFRIKTSSLIFLSSKFHHLNSQAKQLFISYFYIYILSCIYTDIPLYEHVADLNKKPTKAKKRNMCSSCQLFLTNVMQSEWTTPKSHAYFLIVFEKLKSCRGESLALDNRKM